MQLADVYAKYNETIVKAEGLYIWNKGGRKILDFYSGHGVISIGHQHPVFVSRLKQQLDKLVYYSNAVILEEQKILADRLGALASCQDSQLFLVNSGAEAVENALKLASFATGRKKVIACKRAFHGRTDLAAQCSDSEKIRAPINQGLHVVWLDLNDVSALEKAWDDEVCAFIVEGIQGIGGIHVPNREFLRSAETLREQHGGCLILDEIQSGYGRSGRFFAHQWAEIQPDIITMAKGMGNGFPIGGLIIASKLELQQGMLGTTFGGNPLACAAATAVLDVIEEEGLIRHADELGSWLKEKLRSLPHVKDVRGQGLMLAIDLDFASSKLRSELFYQHGIIVGSASSPETVRLLPPLTIEESQCTVLLDCLAEALHKITKED